MTNRNLFTPDQTQFGAESLLYDDPGLDPNLAESTPESRVLVKSLKNLSPLMKVGIAVGSLAVLSALMVLIVSLVGNQDQSGQSASTPTPTENRAIKDPLRQRLTELEKELEAADPAQENQPFPPVDMDLGVDN